jgi:hypothetical protein
LVSIILIKDGYGSPSAKAGFLGMGPYCTRKPLKGNRMAPGRILKTKFNLTNVQLGIIWYNIWWQERLMREVREHNLATGAGIPYGNLAFPLKARLDGTGLAYKPVTG